MGGDGQRIGAERTRFIGREQDLLALHGLFAGGARLVTVLGPAGMGKTRLALRHAAERAGGAPGESAFFCDLAEAHDAEAVCAALAETLAVPLSAGLGGEATAAHLGRALAARGPALVVLDNFEQIVAHAPATVGRWLREAPEALFLATSRERLGIEGEVVHELEPLEVPAEDAGEEVGRSAAVQLFEDRAAAADPGWVLAAEQAPLVAEIVRRLDGIPLAIELAAARIAVLGPAQILERLPKRMDLLRRVRPGEHPRQATLRAALDASWDQLQPWERAALAQLSVFRGGFAVEAAEEVLDLSPAAVHDEKGARSSPPPILPALDVVQALKDKSLLRSYAPPGAPGELRLGMYESIRDYAAEQLTASGGKDAAEERHALYHLSVGCGWAERVMGLGGAEFYRRLVLEQDNLLAVVERQLVASPRTPASAARALEGMLALDPVFLRRGPLGTALALLDAALATAEETPGVDRRLIGEALQARASARQARGQTAAGVPDLERALAIARETGDLRAEGRAQGRLAVLLHVLGRYDEARRNYEQGLAKVREAGDRGSEGLILGNFATHFHDLRAMDQARERYEQAATILREAGHRSAEAMALANLGLLLQESGMRAEAMPLYEQALAILREVGGRRFEGTIEMNLGRLHHVQGDAARARVHYDLALKILRQVGDRRNEGVTRADVAMVLQEGGHVEDARVEMQAAVALVEEAGDRLHHGRLLAALGGILASLDRVEEAERAFSRAEVVLGADAEPTRRAELALHQGNLELARARRAEGRGDVRAAGALREAARRAIEEATSPGAPDAAHAGGTPSFADRSDDVRLAVRVLARALEAGRPAPLGSLAEAPAAALAVDVDGGWVRPPGRKKPVSLKRRQPLRRLIARLAEERLDQPGHALSLDLLLAAGWPGEKVLPLAASNRVYVALTELRKLGLKDVLVKRDEGYLFDPAVPLVQVGRAP